MCFYFIRIYFYVDAVDAAPEENQASLKRVVGRKKKKKKNVCAPEISSFISLQRSSQCINALCRATLAFRRGVHDR